MIPLSASVRRCADGTVYVSCGAEITSSTPNITKKLEYWAAVAPDRTFLAQRNSDGAWRTVTYLETLTRVRRIAQSLLCRNLSADRPVAILSDNSIEHALLALACMYVGVIYAPIAPAYCLAAREYSTLNLLWRRFGPKLVFAAEGARFEQALLNVPLEGIEVVSLDSRPSKIASTHFSELESFLRNRRGRPRESRRCPGHHCQSHVHFGLDREPQGSDQHATYAVLESRDDS